MPCRYFSIYSFENDDTKLSKRRVALFALLFWLKTEFARGPGRGDTCHLSNLDETLPD